MSPRLPSQYTDFRGGLDTKDAPYLLDEGLGELKARDIANVQATTAGAIVKRNGLVSFAVLAAAPTSLFPFEATATLFLVAAAGTALVSISTAGAVVSIATGLTAAKPWEFCTAPIVSGQGPLFGVNGTDTPQQWSGAGSTANWTNATGAVAVPNGKYCIYANNQVFISGVAATPSRVFWSAVSNPTEWDPALLHGAGFEDFDPNDGQAITAIGKVGPYVLVAKPRKLWVLVDTATATSRKLSDQVGCVSHRSMQPGAEGTYFLSEDRGVYVTNGSSLQPLSDIITPTIQAIGAGLQPQCAGGYFNGHYYLSIPRVGSLNDTVLDYDATLQSWWLHTFGSNQMVIWHPAGVAGIYSARPNFSLIDQAFAPGVFTDNGSAMTWVWRGPWQSPSFIRRRLMPTAYYRKRLRQIRWDGAGTVDLSLAKDFAGAETLLKSNSLADVAAGTFGGAGTYGGSGTFGGGPSLKRNRIKSGLGVANAFSIVFGATSTTADSVTSYMIDLIDRVDSVG